MAKPDDAVMPVLRKIQNEITAGCKDVKAMRAKVDEMADKFNEIEQLLVYNLGLTSQHPHTIKTIEASIQTMQSRMIGIEGRS